MPSARKHALIPLHIRDKSVDCAVDCHYIQGVPALSAGPVFFLQLDMTASVHRLFLCVLFLLIAGPLQAGLIVSGDNDFDVCEHDHLTMGFDSQDSTPVRDQVRSDDSRVNNVFDLTGDDSDGPVQTQMLGSVATWNECDALYLVPPQEANDLRSLPWQLLKIPILT